jgi:dTDP-4-amino-4,6-dideoxygalactose transaminase
VPFVDLKAQLASIRNDVLSAVADCLDSMDLILGPNVRAFESEFASYCDARYGVGVGSGTDALYLALRTCGIGPGDEVITVSHTFVATAEAIIVAGATPVFVDIDPETYTMDPTCIEAAIGPRTRAILPVHLYGQMADMEAITEIAQRRGLLVIEDACQAHGAEYRGRRAGSVGDAAAFSFYMSKNLGAYGEAGAVTTNSRAIAEGVAMLRDHGSVRKYAHDDIGVNARLDEIQAAVLRVKLRHLDTYTALRQAHAQEYAQLLEGAGVEVPIVRDGATHVFHLYVVQTSDRDHVARVLADRAVATGVHYPTPIHLQPAFSGVGRVVGELAVTERVANRILSLPMYPELQPTQLAYVAECLRECASG